MRIEKPNDPAALRCLWKQAFGDDDSFLDSFFSLGFSPERCRCVLTDGALAAAAYWFDLSFHGNKLAYIYGVATHESRRGRGICHTLMENIHAHLRQNGYQGALLVPGSQALFCLYAGMGYRVFCGMENTKVAAKQPAAQLKKLDKMQFCALRQMRLPRGGIDLSGAMLDMADAMYDFYEAQDALLCVAKNARALTIAEFLGKREQLAHIVAALGTQASVRLSADTPFAMFLPLQENAKAPAWFSLALD